MKKQIQYALTTLAIIGSSLCPQNSLANETNQERNETNYSQEQKPTWTFIQTEHPDKENCKICSYYKGYKSGETKPSFHYEENLEEEKITFIDFPRKGVYISFYPCSEGNYEVNFSDEVIENIFKHFPGEEMKIESKDFPAKDWKLRIKKSGKNIETIIGGLPEHHEELFKDKIEEYRFHQGCND